MARCPEDNEPLRRASTGTPVDVEDTTSPGALDGSFSGRLSQPGIIRRPGGSTPARPALAMPLEREEATDPSANPIASDAPPRPDEAGAPPPPPTPDPLVPASMDDTLPAGTMVGEYRVEGKLGEGGMGYVYAAVHPVIGKRAAIKVVRRELCADQVMVERFVQEARAVNRIGHPNIVDVFAFGLLADGRPYLVMEWLRGETLAERLCRGPLPVEEALDTIDAIGRALSAAHEHGIIHRDLKPENVFLTNLAFQAPVVKLLDFGIAKLTGGDDHRLERTRTGSLLGSPYYLSPEQARGKNVDHRTDIYALGAVAYELLAGDPPFLADTAIDIITAQLEKEPARLGATRADVPARLERLVARMLEKEADKRPSLDEVREQLELLRSEAREAGGFDKVAMRPSGRRGLLLAALAAVGLLAGLGVWLATRGEGGATTSAGLLADAAITHHGAAPPADATPPGAPLANLPDAGTGPGPGVVAPAAGGTLVVTVDVKNARIIVDGRTVAAAADGARVPIAKTGEHSVVVTSRGRRPFRKTVFVGGGATVTVEAILDRRIRRPGGGGGGGSRHNDDENAPIPFPR